MAHCTSGAIRFSALLKDTSTGNRTSNLLITKRLLYLLYHCRPLINAVGSDLHLQALRHLRNVQVINFGDCLVRSEGAMAIADTLVEGLPILKVGERTQLTHPQ